MTKLITANTGSFPRIGEGGEGQKLRRAFARRDSGKISREELKLVEGEAIEETVSLQDKAGLDLLTDGLIGWHDPVSHLMGKLAGVEVGPLARFFDTNTYYRQPIVGKKIAWEKPLIVDEFVFAQRITPKPIKPVLTGPGTLARLSMNNAYGNLNQLMEAIGHVIAREVEALAQAGAAVIQIDEPAVLQHPEDMEILLSLLEEIAGNKGEAQLALYTYFGDAARIYDHLQKCPVDILGLDFTYSQRLPEVITVSGAAQVLGLGIIDGRNTRMEIEAGVFPLLESLLRLPGMEKCYLNPSCGLEYLPRKKAVAKLKNMVRLRDKFLGGNE